MNFWVCYHSVHKLHHSQERVWRSLWLLTVTSPVWICMLEVQLRLRGGACEWVKLLSPLATTDELPLNFKPVKLLKGQQVERCVYWEVSWKEYVLLWRCSMAVRTKAWFLCKFHPWMSEMKTFQDWQEVEETERCHCAQVPKYWPL